MRPAIEYETFTGGPLPIRRLVQIWRGLDEDERLGFYHSLDETIADRLMAAVVKSETPIGLGRDTQQRVVGTPAADAVASEQHAR